MRRPPWQIRPTNQGQRTKDGSMGRANFRATSLDEDRDAVPALVQDAVRDQVPDGDPALDRDVVQALV
jgi:hypothetical protein